MPSLTRSAKDRGRRDELRDAVEQRVLTAVERLLSEGTPFTEIPVQRIASEADIARSTFYRYFPDKSRLLIRMAELATADQFRTAEQWWARDHPEGMAGVVAAMRDMIVESRKHHLLLRALVEVAAYDVEVGEYWRGRVTLFTQVVRERLDRDRRAGRVAAELDVDATAVVLACMVERSINFVFTAKTPLGDEELAGALGRAIWLTLYGIAPADSTA